jgi:hypothetical protein
MKKENPIHHIHIGSIIKAKAAERGISETQLAKMIYCHISNIHYIFEKNDIHVKQLWKISVALQFNFFTEIYGNCIAKEIDNFQDTSTVYIMISPEKISVERNNGMKQITEYRKILEK